MKELMKEDFNTVIIILWKWDNRVEVAIVFLELCGLFPAGIYMFKLNNGNTRKMCEIFSKLTIKTTEWLD